MNDTAATAGPDATGTDAGLDGRDPRASRAHPPGRRCGGVPGGFGRRTLRMVRRAPHWAPLPLGLGLGLACGLGYGLTATPQYAATAYVMVVPAHGGDPAAALGFAQAYGRIVTGSAVLAGAQDAAGAPAADLRGRVQAATSPDAPMVSVTGTGTGGAAAARVADAVADSLARTGNATSASTGVRLLVFARATAPAAPSSPSAPLSAAVGAAAGGLLGGLVLFVRPGRPGRGGMPGADGDDVAAAADGQAAVPAQAPPVPPGHPAHTAHPAAAGTSAAEPRRAAV